jgi:glucose-1-phosphate adenylyltransferase
MVSTGIRNVCVITDKNYLSLIDHLGSGKDWDLARKNEGLFIMSPFASPNNLGEYIGTVDALNSILNHVSDAKEEYVLMTGTHTIYNTSYEDFFAHHIASGADISVMCFKEKGRPKFEDRYNDVRYAIGARGRIKDIEINPKNPQSQDACLNVYIMKRELFLRLIENFSARGKNHFNGNVLRENLNKLKITAYEYKGYARKLHSVGSYYGINMDFLSKRIQREVLRGENRILTKIKDEVPTKHTPSASLQNSLVADGCILEGKVTNSVLFRGVHVRRGAKIENCIIMQSSDISQRAHLRNVILDKNVKIREGLSLLGDKEYPIIIRKGSSI